MAGFVYSTQFAKGFSSASGTITLYTVPTAKVAIVRDITGVVAVSTGEGFFQNPSGQSFWGFSALAAPTAFHFEGRIVLNAGDVIDLLNVSGEFSYVVSGYLLDA